MDKQIAEIRVRWNTCFHLTHFQNPFLYPRNRHILLLKLDYLGFKRFNFINRYHVGFVHPANQVPRDFLLEFTKSL